MPLVRVQERVGRPSTPPAATQREDLVETARHGMPHQFREQLGIILVHVVVVVVVATTSSRDGQGLSGDGWHA